ncbi:MAG: DUF2652 domain-containing protein [Chitinophagales bacterium]
MENRGLIFIPDISGFTRFVNETEIEHSRYIIQELLEVLINSNQIGLEISEIEGDAILFYKYGDAPELKAIYQQVEKMFCEFHRRLIAYEQRRICRCNACKSANDLTLKVITHYGEFTGYNVKNFSKLIGKDIILAHQLLKNDIDHHEYWLVTDGLMKDDLPTDLPQWVAWSSSTKQTDNGKVGFQYTHLGQLKDSIPADTLPQLEINDKVKMFSVSREIDAEINTLFYTMVDFSSRQNWQEGIKKTDEVSHTLTQIGTRHRCILEKGHVLMYTSSFSHSPDKIVYSETEAKKKHENLFTFEKTGENKTRITVDVYLKKNLIVQTIFNLTMKKKFENSFRQSLENLAALVKGGKLPVEV